MMDRLIEQREQAASAALQLDAEYGEVIAQYQTVATSAVAEAIERLRTNVDAISGNNASVRAVIDRTASYLHWLSWTTWDLPQLAVVTRPDPERFRADLSASALVYFAGRILDDYLDRHFLYRGRRETLLAGLALDRGDGAESEALTVVMSLLLCFEGLQHARAFEQTAVIIKSVRSLLVGILMERSRREEWSAGFYERLVRLKNVDYWRILYSSLDPGMTSPLYPFLCRYYALAQKLNDLQDPGRDAEQGRPNLVAVHGADAGEVIARDLLDLGEMARQLEEPARWIALAKVGESQQEAERLGLFPEEPPMPPSVEPLQLIWHSQLSEFVERLGMSAVEETDCPVCGTGGAAVLFRKSGFAYRRCPGCTHIYVSPRLTPAVQQRLGEELDAGPEDEFLQTQKIYADYLCRFLRKQAAGPRLLDVGYGSGYLLRTARAHGFQVYGVEASRTLTSKLEGMLGRHLEVSHLGAEPLPWGSFDVVVMTHVLEHVADPRPVLANLLQSLHPDGVLYLAVPDNESWQFRIFGKEWDAVNPVAHYQFFNESSLTRALRAAGFQSPVRVRMPPLEGALRQRWMGLFRSLGGDESGELAMMARRPHDSGERNPRSMT